MTALKGAYTALVTPFVADGSTVDIQRLEQNIRQQAAGGVTGVVPCGTTGEAPTLTDQEHRVVVEKTVELAKSHGLQVIAGAGSNNTKHAIHLHRFAHAAGADAALHVTPYYNKPSQEGMYRHFMAVADSCGLPVVMYNIPGRTCVALSADTIERLAAHPNIQAIKEATGSLDQASEIALRTDLALLCGDDTLTLPMASVGGVGVVSVVSNLVPQKVADLCRAFLEGDWEAARILHGELFGLSRGLLSLATNPIAVKAALQILGRDTGAVRLPLWPPDQETRQAIEEMVAVSGLRAAELTV
ncbi:MAG: 4-hydroxy-tetrahydrodipicolinate synthase [Planctomycetota bacterium]|nr:4-hydroxy-tetrahydrodipicolinate synthase [Planctomycetota bacterium]MCZ6611856.1 4-hydroxy-tetrahydrodipicolinate synthase [Planctomycetota bacterium]